jgi:phenylpropionate dioxygenase-like ring-hydroxylating dioxygenase large terminal subunit
MTFLKNIWYVAGHAEDISSTPFARTILDEPIVFFRTAEGKPVALDNRCPHRLAPIDKGKVVDDVIQCPYHGLRFNASGVCVSTPSGDEAPPRARLTSYAIVERHNLLWIWMGDAELADPSMIADYSSLQDSQFGWFTGYLHARANYQLIVDNLLDLSHAEFLHPLLSSDGWGARNRQTITRDGETIFVRNVAENDNILPINRIFNPALSPTGTTIHEERWDAPGQVTLMIKYFSATGDSVTPSAHFVTPETETTSHYFIIGGQDVQPQNAEFTAQTKAGVLEIFEQQDIPLIEAQQRFLGTLDLLEYKPAILKTDSGGMRARRIMAYKIHQEAEHTTSTKAIA